MLFFEIILALWWIWLPLLAVWFIVSRDNNKKNSSTNDSKDLQWHNYILSFKDVVKTKAEKNLLEAMLTRKTASQLYEVTTPKNLQTTQLQTVDQPVMDEPVSAEVEEPMRTEPKSQPMDNTLLLLYFGAFLLVASAGLFVAIGKLDGLVRTITLAITATILYWGGVWLYQNRKKLSQAGISFMGTGMIIAPLVGVAWYNLVAEQTNGALIWFVTSIACLVLYMHALSVANNSFVAYLLIGSFVSSIESAVLTVSLPSYVYVWALIGASLLLQVSGVWRGQSKVLLQAGDTSAQLLVPLSILGSLALLPNLGSMQLAITLFLAASYYSLLAWQRPTYMTEYLTAAQASTIAAIGNTAYYATGSFWQTGLVLGVIASCYAVAIAGLNTTLTHKLNLVLISALVSSSSILLVIEDAWSLVVCSTVALVLSATIWLKLHNQEAFSIGGLILLALPFAIGQYALDPHIDSGKQLLFCVVPAIILGAISIYTYTKENYEKYNYTAVVLYVLSSLILITTAWFAGFSALLITSALLAVSFAVLQYESNDSEWWIYSSLVILLPAVFALLNYGIDDKAFALTVGLGLFVNIAISLTTREQAIRWILVGCILVAPLAVGGGGLGIRWDEAGYAGGYILAMVGCMFARAIARGKLFVSSKVAVSSYEKGSSQAYIAGYILSACIAIIISFLDDNSQLVTTLVLGVVSIALIYIAYRIESNNESIILLPILLQAMLFSAVRPDVYDKDIAGFTALLSSGLAILLYLIFEILITSSNNSTWQQLLRVTVLTSFVGPAIVLFGAEYTIMLSLSLTLAGGLTTYHNRHAKQDIRELSIGIIIASGLWLLNILGVTNVQIYTHLIALSFACFAYWRYLLGDKKGSINHVQIAYFIATIPLILQALYGTSGDFYGLSLIIQQAGFMLVGVLLNLRFLIQAGLWVALGSVLYQLRGLGWAFLGLVAIILIGVAVYRLEKHGDEQKPK